MPPSRPPLGRRRGDLGTREFLGGVLERTRARLPVELAYLNTRQEGSLIKLFADEAAIHFELWLHLSRGRVEVGLHFETRDADRNRRLLEYVADELLFLKDVIGPGLEAELWDKGWTRVYISYPLEQMDVDAQQRLAERLAVFVETLEPIRREALESED